MKKILMPLVAMAFVVASCGTHSGDNYTNYNYREYNFISDIQDSTSVANISGSVYSVKMNWNQNTAELSTYNLVLDNQNVSFETNPMPLFIESVKDPFSVYYVQQGTFSSKDKENVGKGATITDLSALFTTGVYNVPMNVPGFSTPVISEQRLVLDYKINDRYRVRTFWSDCFYIGDTFVYGSEGQYTTQSTFYFVQLDLSKKTAKVVVYAPKFSDEAKDEDMPNAFVLSDIPVIITHDTYYMQVESPKTEILITTAGKNELQEPGKYQITDFKFNLTSEDMASAKISFTVDGKDIVFDGNCIVKKKI